MAHPHPLTWRQDDPDCWSAWADDRLVARIRLRRQYELTSEDGDVRGSHSALGSAQAQLEAWYQWESAARGA